MYVGQDGQVAAVGLDSDHDSSSDCQEQPHATVTVLVESVSLTSSAS